MSDIKIGAQLYTIRNFTKTPDELEKAFTKIKEIGFDLIQISAIGPIEPARLSAIVQKLGLEVCCTHSNPQRIFEDLDALIEEHKMINCPIIGMGSMPGEFKKDGIEGIKRYCHAVNEVGRKLASNGMKFGYHNHMFEFSKVDGKLVYDIMQEETDPEFVTFIMDFYWLQAGGIFPADFIRKNGDRCIVAHFKDMEIVENKQTTAPVGEGNMNYVEILKACRDVKIPYAVIEQDNCLRDPFDCLDSSFRYLKSIM